VNHFRGPVQVRSLASNFWALGADGVYLFNFFGVPGQEVNPGWGASDASSLQEIGAVETLRKKDKVYLADSGETLTYIGYSNPESQFPVRLIGEREVELVVGDDLHAAAAEGSLKELRLEFNVGGIGAGEQVQVQVNGVDVPPGRIARTRFDVFAADLEAGMMRRGINRFRFAPGTNSAGRLTAQVGGMKLHVQYR